MQKPEYRLQSMEYHKISTFAGNSYRWLIYQVKEIFKHTQIQRVKDQKINAWADKPMVSFVAPHLVDWWRTMTI